MLGMFNLLPLLKAWEYKTHTATRTVVRGAAPIEVLRVEETGWIVQQSLLTDDAYGTVMVDWQGADLQTLSGSLYPEAGRLLGALVQDPAGWVQKYYRPNPYSTAGVYLALQSTGGYQGSAFPYVPSVVVRLYLPNESTQASATIQAVTTSIAITNKKSFIQSLRRVLDANASLKIDPALLSVGPGEMREIGQ